MHQTVRNFIRNRPQLLRPLARAYGLKLRQYGCTLDLDETGTRLAVRKANREIHIAIEMNYHLRDIAIEFEDFFESIVPEQRPNRQIADFSAPRLHAIPDIEVPFTFTFVPETKSTNEAYLAALQPHTGQVVIDAGAYCGLSSYLFAKAVGATGRVVAVEADPQNYRFLFDNIARTGAKNISCVHAALWKEVGELNFQAEGSMSSTIAENSPRSDRTARVQAIPLSILCEQQGLERVDHVKLDIEGAEYDVVYSSAAFIEQFKPDFLIEPHPAGGRPADIQGLTSFFAQHGYGLTEIPQRRPDFLPLLHFTCTAA